MLYTDQIRSIFAASPNPCLILVPDKADFTIAGVNETWLQAVGVPNEQLVGKGLARWLAENKVGFTRLARQTVRFPAACDAGKESSSA